MRIRLRRTSPFARIQDAPPLRPDLDVTEDLGNNGPAVPDDAVGGDAAVPAHPLTLSQADIAHPVTVHINRWMLLLYVFGSLVMGATSQLFFADRRLLNQLLGWLIAVFFLGGAGILGIQMLPGSNYARLTSEHLVLRKVFFRTAAYRWSDIGRFSAVVQGYRLSTTWAVFKITHGPRAGRRVVVMVYAPKGRSGVELVDFLNAWRHAALEASHRGAQGALTYSADRSGHSSSEAGP